MGWRVIIGYFTSFLDSFMKVANEVGCVDEGSEAPDLELQDQDSKVFKLSSTRGKYVVLYFYPKAMTRGCFSFHYYL